jgi:hypothetical protein
MPPSVSWRLPVEIVTSYGTLVLPEGVWIPGSVFRLCTALVLAMETTRDGIVLRSGFVDEESYGTTVEEACIDFLTSLKDRLMSLERREPVLSIGDCKILETLRCVVRSYATEVT